MAQIFLIFVYFLVREVIFRISFRPRVLEFICDYLCCERFLQHNNKGSSDEFGRNSDILGDFDPNYYPNYYQPEGHPHSHHHTPAHQKRKLSENDEIAKAIRFTSTLSTFNNKTEPNKSIQIQGITIKELHKEDSLDPTNKPKKSYYSVTAPCKELPGYTDHSFVYQNLNPTPCTPRRKAKPQSFKSDCADCPQSGRGTATYLTSTPCAGISNTKKRYTKKQTSLKRKQSDSIYYLSSSASNYSSTSCTTESEQPFIESSDAANRSIDSCCDRLEVKKKKRNRYNRNRHEFVEMGYSRGKKSYLSGRRSENEFRPSVYEMFDI